MQPPVSRGECLWVVTDDTNLEARAQGELVPLGVRVRTVAPADLDAPAFWRTAPRHPGALLLDAHTNLDRACSILRRIRKARVQSPVIVTTANESREFGTKIVSLGVAYILPCDFAAGELAEVYVGLVKPSQPPVASDGQPSNFPPRGPHP